ncbi:MAG: translation elongation factor 4 [Candidatus Dormibacteraceae bacterium]
MGVQDPVAFFSIFLESPDVPQDLIRNFCIIAHIDHGKSTLADRLLEQTGTVGRRNMHAQVLDTLELEQERGITIKLQAVRMSYPARDGRTYELNLIDTPGHVDFSYEVSRSLAACDGALLVVDAAQGVEAQTLATLYQAVDANLELIPVINKIDLPAAQPEAVAQEIIELTGIDASRIVFASAKSGEGVPEILEAIVAQVPPPGGDPERPLSALVFDSHYDAYRGVIVYVRVMDGEIRPGMRIRMMNTGSLHEVDEVGWFVPTLHAGQVLRAGEVGYLTASIKNVKDARVGDTVTLERGGASEPLPGYRPVKPMVFAGIFPTISQKYQDLKDALERFQLNDAAFVFEPENSAALGFGFRCGFLGLLHMEIVQERLEREFGLELITTAPTVQYRVVLRSGEELTVDNPALLPDPMTIEHIEEPHVRVTVVVPADYVGPMMELCQDRRGAFRNLEHQSGGRVLLEYDLPLAEIIHDFYDQLKSRSRGYASMDYELIGMRPARLVKLDVLVAGEAVDALSMIVEESHARQQGRRLTERLRALIPRQLFEVPLQAAIGGRIVARETIPAMRKDVISKCYGGDITRKRKLLEKQKEGKRRMKRVGSVEIPQEAFMAVLSLGD